MEDALSAYERPYGEWRSVACMDEKPYQLLEEARDWKAGANEFIVRAGPFLIPYSWVCSCWNFCLAASTSAGSAALPRHQPSWLILSITVY